ncbi:Pumilio domain-containing protein C56F2.08c [Fusarium proliferatum]|uniref:Pumilio domain-containing protein C56F2.08c n=1 Tax=Gibberella intermedia TaxID=948311 RepID=A0A420SZT9_GIBIN|nr:Pumilio domain-containing protein C56F2.08c [Fusarium proliferatum]
MSTSRSEHLALGYASSQPRSGSPSASNSPIDPLPPSRSPFGLSGGLNPSSKMAGISRSGAGSPSHELPGSSRLFSKRAREIQAQEGVPGMPGSLWGGPPTSGNSTPLRENIPESPTDGFPDFAQLPTPDSMPQTRRARAGTVPSRFSPGGAGNGMIGIPGLVAKTNRPTPTQSPFKSPSPNPDAPENSSSSSTLLSRLRAGSMPQRSQFAPIPGTSSPFGPSIFSSWNPTGVGRERASTLASIASVGSNGPSSPAQSQFSKEGGGESDVHMRTLDYLGLAETPQPPRAQLATPYLANLDFTKQASRFRSYSVNNKDKYADDEDDYDTEMPLDPQYVAALQDQLAATNAAIHSHNLAVQAFANQANRPRARTAGVLDTPGSRLMRTYMSGNSNLSNPVAPAEIRLQDEKDYEDLPQAVAGINLGRSSSRNAGLLSADEQGLEGPTSALWLGSIPTSTTTSTLIEMFKSHGPILSARVLTHKNCGFVNFERVESAISAKASMNSKEIFPGAGPIRINFAKPPSASNTPGHDGVFPSPSPDPFAKGQDNVQGTNASTPAGDTTPAIPTTNATPKAPALRDMTTDILDIVKQFGASEEDRFRISRNLQSAIQFNSFVEEIPPIREPAHTRVHDAPKLRDIRKRIDNQSLSQAEIENIAVDMLPEIAELSSDYLGNTVVQKLFEHCSDQLRDAMLSEIAPHMAEIGVHKNGTWAAQKIIDVCKTPAQMSLIVEHIRPYTIPLFLDQYGNYVLQGCLKFGAPYNDFIFETMLARMWEISQGRYGARAMRACLESHHSTKDQQRMLAATIALNSVQLATNANGALLLTWFLDTCTFPQRRTVLSPQLVPYLVHLCTHKVAYLTVLKVINQKAEADARDTILQALFFTPNDQVLEAILKDHQCGATLIFKVLTTPFFDESIRNQVVENVKNVLLRIKAQPNQGYKRLMDEVGLSTRSTGNNRDVSTHAEQRQRPSSRQANSNGHHANSAHSNKPFYNPMNQSTNPPGFDMPYGGQRNEPADGGVSAFPQFNQSMMYNAPGGPMPANLQQMQYQQMMNRGPPPMNFNYPPMQAGYGGFNGPNPSVDQYRQQNIPNGSPIQPPVSQMPQMPQMPAGQTPFAPPGFGMGMGNYGYGNMGGMPNMGYMQQQEQGNPRRGRVRQPQSRNGQQRRGG